MKPTPEQEAIIEAALQSTDNLLINALAGAAKTTTLEMICKAMPVQPVLSLAFNKRIAEEMTKRLPGHVLAKTLNAVGHGVWQQTVSKRLTVDTKKSYNILKGIVDGFGRTDKEDAYEVFGDVLKLVGKAKVAGYVPQGVMPHATRLSTYEDFWNACDEEGEFSDWTRSLVDQVLQTAIQQSYGGFIDFDDQIYMPTLFGGTFPQFPNVMVDEAQDLSALNHEMLKKLARGRLFAVGDPWQSIYGFRGAVFGGMARLQRNFNMREMNLSISFRCPRRIVENARFRAPHMQWAETAIEGEIKNLEIWDAQTIPDNAAIICRNNAPLFSLAFKLLRSSRNVKLVGFDVGPNLLKSFRKLGSESMNKEEMEHAITAWEKEKLRTAKAEGTIRDKAECFRAFADFGDTLGQACAYAKHLFETTGTIQLLSGHKSKGLEWDHVYHLDPHRCPSPYARTDEEKEQELNVRYVIETRAKKELVRIRMEDFDV